MSGKPPFEFDSKTGRKRSMFRPPQLSGPRSVQIIIMRDHIRILGWCFIVYSAIIVLVGFGIGSVVMFGGMLSGDHEAIFITSAVGTAIVGDNDHPVQQPVDEVAILCPECFSKLGVPRNVPL